MDKKCPKCYQILVWVDNGRNLQYFYCKDCKKELDELQREADDLQIMDWEAPAFSLSDLDDEDALIEYTGSPPDDLL